MYNEYKHRKLSSRAVTDDNMDIESVCEMYAVIENDDNIIYGSAILQYLKGPGMKRYLINLN